MGIAAGAVAGFFLVWTVIGYLPTRGIETPAYEVVSEADGYEVRLYQGFIRAKVTVPGEYDEALGNGFRKVADYIFGNNTKKAKVAMTAPVLSEEQGKKSEKIAMTAPVLSEDEDAGQSHTVAFVMPSEYTMETLPEPNNDEVTLEEVPARRYAVLEFSGYARASRVEKKKAKLLEALKRDGVEILGEPIVAQYDPPWTPPYMRHNEIWVLVGK